VTLFGNNPASLLSVSIIISLHYLDMLHLFILLSIKQSRSEKCTLIYTALNYTCGAGKLGGIATNCGQDSPEL
jgi:hypothetical protein